MNVLRFVNSKDIRNHLETIGYQFNSLEAAWLIHECRDATVEEKHKAWKELIETMPDCDVPKRVNTVPQASLHTFLKKYMDLENKYINQFFNQDKQSVYQYRYSLRNGSQWNNWSNAFSSIEKIFGNDPDSEVSAVHCRKYEIDKNDHELTAIFTTDLKLLKIEPYGLEEEEYDIINGVFEGLWFDFPTPFKKGDIVWNPQHPDSDCVSGGPFVLENVNLDRIVYEKTKESRRKYGDTSDMDADGYFVNPDGGIYYENMWNYMDLEYYREELTGIQRILIPLSSFMKGKIDIGLFARAYHQIMTEIYLERIKPRMYTEEGLALAGIHE